jgi:potassium-transporting ATPase potassium-binding subunit
LIDARRNIAKGALEHPGRLKLPPLTLGARSWLRSGHLDSARCGPGQFALFALLVWLALVLIFAGASSTLKIALDSLGAGGPHGLSEVVYAYASSAADNGSAFAGLNANTPWYNVTTGVAMFFGCFAHAIPILAVAGSLAAKKKAKPSAGTMPTDGPLFVGFLLAVVAIVTLLQYLPALALGPIAEHFLAGQGATF